MKIFQLKVKEAKLFFLIYLDLFKLFADLKKPLIQKLLDAEKQNFKFEWKTHDFEDVNSKTFVS